MPATLPTPGSDYNTWATELNAFLRSIAVSVQDYGADPTGVSDSLSAFTSATNAKSSGGLIYVPEGTYDLSDHVPTYSNQYWFGPGTLNATRSPQDKAIFNVTGKTRVVFDGLKFTGPADADSEQGAIYIYGSSTQIVVRNCTMDGFRKGVQLDAIQDAWILNNRIINGDSSHSDRSAYGIKLDDACRRIMIDGNLISNLAPDSVTNVGHGIYFDGSSGNEVMDCVIRGNVIRQTCQDGIRLLYAHRNVIANNVIEDAGEGGANGRGIYLTTSVDDNVIESNQIRSCVDECIMVAGGASTADRNIVRGNRCATSNHGIYISAGDDNLVTNNLVYNNTSDGIGIAGVSLRNLITGNVVRTQIDGVEINADGDENVVRGNVISGCTTGVRIDASADNNVVRENMFTGCTTEVSDSGTGTKLDQPTAGNATSVDSTATPSFYTYKLEVFDEAGTSLGYIPVHDDIT